MTEKKQGKYTIYIIDIMIMLYNIMITMCWLTRKIRHHTGFRWSLLGTGVVWGPRTRSLAERVNNTDSAIRIIIIFM